MLRDELEQRPPVIWIGEEWKIPTYTHFVHYLAINVQWDRFTITKQKRFDTINKIHEIDNEFCTYLVGGYIWITTL